MNQLKLKYETFANEFIITFCVPFPVSKNSKIVDGFISQK